jgi:hypothetical protein
VEIGCREWDVFKVMVPGCLFVNRLKGKAMYVLWYDYMATWQW